MKGKMGEKQSRMALPLLVFCLGCCLLAGVPALRGGMIAVWNRIADLSEARNTYVYDRLSGGIEENMPWALLVAGVTFATLSGVLYRINRHAAGLFLAAMLVSAQAYLGLTLPSWMNVICFTAIALSELRDGWKHGGIPILFCVLVLSLLVFLLAPGVNAGTEARSEQFRDWLGHIENESEQDRADETVPRMETRHTNEKSVDTGEKEARGTEGYRLVRIERMQISRPEWLNIVRIAIVSLFILLFLTAPFVPFVLLNGRRTRAQRQRGKFESQDPREAVEAMTWHIVQYLRKTGHGTASLPYRAWQLQDLPYAYQQRFAETVQIFEESVYSDHAINEDQRRTVRECLMETERLFFDEADWKQRFRLRVVECLHE